jgi:hypothetical protein
VFVVSKFRTSREGKIWCTAKTAQAALVRKHASE